MPCHVALLSNYKGGNREFAVSYLNSRELIFRCKTCMAVMKKSIMLLVLGTAETLGIIKERLSVCLCIVELVFVNGEEHAGKTILIDYKKTKSGSRVIYIYHMVFQIVLGSDHLLLHTPSMLNTANYPLRERCESRSRLKSQQRA